MNAPAIQVKAKAPRHVYDPEKDDLVLLEGDPLDPGDDGVAATYRLPSAADAKVLLLHTYENGSDIIVECEVYRDPGNGQITIHMICPHCRHSLTIPSTKKSMDWDPTTGLLSVEPCQCTWEEKSDQDVAKTNSAFLLRSNLCGFKFAIDHNVIRCT